MPASRPNCRQPALLILGLTLVLGTPDRILEAADNPFKQDGVSGNHELYSALPNESVDPLSGNLLLSATDLILPGNAGLDLAVTRFYSSQVFPDYENNQSTAVEDDTWAGLGWRLHWGRVLHTETAASGQTVVELPGGGGGPLYTTNAYPEGWITKGLARYNRSTHQLKLPNGRVYTFGQVVSMPRGGSVRYVTRIDDPYGNWITFEYFAAPGPADGVQRIRQALSGTDIREVTFTYNPTYKSLATMSYDGRTWTYTQQGCGPAGYSALTKVQPPAGLAWNYGYSAWNGELTTVTMPLGGQIAYTYSTVTRFAASTTRPARVVTQRTTSGPNVTGGTWTFTYSTGSNKDQTVVSCPCGTNRYTFHGTGLSGDFSAWASGALKEHTVEESGTVLQREQFEWLKSEAISYDSVPGENGLWSDAGVFAALLDHKTITRGGQSWDTEYSYHWGQGTINDALQPYQIVTSGERTRTVTRTFQTGFTPHILGAVKTEEIRVGSEAIWSSWDYELATGFLTAARPLGLPTTFTRTAQGNIASAADGNGHATYYQYAWGVANRIQTVHTLTTRTINRDGTIGAETTAGLTTQYGYDALGRLRTVWPPGGGALSGTITINYEGEASGRLIIWKQDATEKWAHMDGFGRVWKQSDAATWTRTERDACGRVTAQSLPFVTAGLEKWTTTAYDALGRAKQVTSPDGKVSNYAYAGNDLTIIDPLSHATTYTYGGSGSPDASVLDGVIDAAGANTRYGYNAVDTLVTVAVPGVPTRIWDYDGNNILLGDTQPETGHTGYQKDPAGLITGISNSLGQITTLTYDGDNRLIGRDAPGSVSDLSITYDSGGRIQTQQTPSATITYTYDGAGRVASRTDSSGGLSWTSSYLYDNRNNLTQITYPSGRVVAYTYDAANRITSVLQNGTVFADAFQYGETGQLTSYRTGAVTHTVTYDAAARVQRLTSGSLLDLTYGYDAASNVAAITDARAGQNQAFQYDTLNRLKIADGSWGRQMWSYDVAGNRLSESGSSTTTYTYDAATQRLTSTGGATPETFTYNALGQLTGDSRANYTYTPTGRLATATGPVTASYTYDPEDLRLVRTVNGHTIYTVRGAGTPILSEYESACAGQVWSRDLIYAGGKLLGAVKATTTQPTVALSSAAATVAESAGTASVSVQLTTPGGAPLACAVTVSFQTLAGTAASGADYTTEAKTLTFATGSENGATRSISLPIVNDAINEFDETMSVRLVGAVGAATGAMAAQTVTIADDDPPPTVSITGGSVQEGNSGTTAVTFTISLSTVSGRDVSLQFATSDATAVAESDYVARTGTVVIGSGSLTAPVTVTIFGDVFYEPTETLSATLSAPVNAMLGASTAVGTILNDDADLDLLSDALLYDQSTGRHWYAHGDAAFGFRTIEQATVWGADWTVAIGDFNGDGINDVFRYHPVTGRAFRELSNGIDFVADPIDGFSWNAGWTLTVLDLNGDGKSDIFVYNAATGEWVSCTSTSAGFVYTAVGQWATSLRIQKARWNSDSKDDLFLYKPTTGQWWRVINDPANGLPVSPAENGLRWSVNWNSYIGDFNGDGLSDVFLYNDGSVPGDVNAGRPVHVITQPGGGETYYYGSTWAVGWKVGLGDLSADGKSDVFLYNPNTGQQFSCITSGLGSFTYYSRNWSAGWVFAVVDLNSDTRSDVLLYAPATGRWARATTAADPAAGFTYFYSESVAGDWLPSLKVVPIPRF